jgi:hypothetical protein
MSWFWNRPKPRPLADLPQPFKAVLGDDIQKQLATFINAVDARHKEIYSAITEGQGALLAAIDAENGLLRDICGFNLEVYDRLGRIEKRLDGIEPQFGNVLGSLTALDTRLEGLATKTQIHQLATYFDIALKEALQPPKQQGGKRSKKSKEPRP